jgi:hypothetical protein
MVLMSGSKRARYESSIVNQNQGGGNKKAGLVPTADIPVAAFNGYRNRGLPKSLYLMRITANPNVQQSRPISSRPVNFIGSGGNY